MIQLSSKRRSELRAEAHKLTPVVIIGDKGLTDEVIAEIDRSLKAHELIKVRAFSDDRNAREAWLPAICERLAAHPVQSIGKVFVIYRENPKEKQAKLAKTRTPGLDSRRRSLPPRASIGGGNDKKDSRRTSRPPPRTPSPRPESAPRRRRRSTSQ